MRDESSDAFRPRGSRRPDRGMTRGCPGVTRAVPDVRSRSSAARSGAAKSALPNAVLRPVRDRNAFEATVEQLASAVRLGALVDGSRLPPERELAGRLGVSRATLREAIA